MKKPTEPDKTFSGSLGKTICKHQGFNITEAITTRQASRSCREAEGGPMEQLSIQINSMEDAVRGIEAAQRKACTAFIEIGYILRKADDAELYKEKGYSSIFIFAEKEYGWDQSQTSRFMSINREYSEGGYSCTLQERYEGYGQAKLAEMLKLPEGLREEITPEMKRDDIRELKRDYRAAEETRQEEQFREAFAPAQTGGTLLEKTARALLSQATYAQRVPDLWPLMLEHRRGKMVNEMDILMALIPSGYGHARVQSYMCFFRREEMSIMHGRDKEKHNYTELLDAIMNLSETAEFDTPENWYQTVFGKELPGKPQEEEKIPENDENPKGNRASGKAENQAEKPAKTIPEKERNHTPHTGGTQEKEESGENPSTEAPGKEENNENPKGNQPLEGQTEIGDFAEQMPITCGETLKKEDDEAVPCTEPAPEHLPETIENNENPKGNQPLEGLADTTGGECPYCRGSKEIYSSNYAFFISLSPSGEGKVGKIAAPQEHETIRFEYCPKCGRKLEE